jgi:competence protein ComEC
MRWIIFVFLLGQWICLYRLGWTGFEDLFWPCALVISVYLVAHFYFSSFTVWQAFKQHATLIVGFSLLVGLLGFYQVHYLFYERQDHQLAENFDGRIEKVIVAIDDLPKPTRQGVQFNAKVIEWLDTSSPLILQSQRSPPNRLAIYWQLQNKHWNSKEKEEGNTPVLHYPEISPGQVWQMSLKLKAPRGLKNPFSFDVEQWMLMQSIDASGFVQKGAAQLLPQEYSSFSTWVATLRYWIRKKVEHSLGPNAQYRGVISALVMGDQQGIAQEDWILFNTTGIGHLISISGLHVTMFSGFGALIAGRIWRKTRLPLKYPTPLAAAIIGFFFALTYTFLVGFQVPAQRTMFMVMLVSIYLYYSRIPKPFDIWWWALACVALLDPWAIFTP